MLASMIWYPGFWLGACFAANQPEAKTAKSCLQKLMLMELSQLFRAYFALRSELRQWDWARIK